MTIKAQRWSDGELRRMGPHLIDCREHFGDIPIEPERWRDEYARHVQVKGRGPGSLEDDETAGLDYHVIDRDGVIDKLPLLYARYCQFAPKISEVLGFDVVASADDGAINVNIVQGSGGRYELHTDSQPWTLLLFAGGEFDGGELVMQHPVCGELVIRPYLGMGVLFDGSVLPHMVRPLQRTTDQLHWVADPMRISIPMVFVDRVVGDRRDPAMSDYLYSGKR